MLGCFIQGLWVALHTGFFMLLCVKIPGWRADKKSGTQPGISGPEYSEAYCSLELVTFALALMMMEMAAGIVSWCYCSGCWLLAPGTTESVEGREERELQ